MWFPWFSPSSLIFILLIAGLVFFLSRQGTAGAERILRERLAKGEVTPEDYGERLALLKTSPRGRLYGLLVIAFILLVVFVLLWSGFYRGSIVFPSVRPQVDLEYAPVPAE